MAETEQDSTVPRRQLGRHLRQLRKRSGITVKATSDYLGCSEQKIWRIEQGLLSVRVTDARALCECFDTDEAMTEAMVGLARQTRATGWWHSYGDAIPEWFELYVSLEAAASHIRTFSAALVHGLLQAPAYMESIFEADEPEMSEEDRREQVAIKTKRRGLLTRHFPPAPQLDVIIWEPVLRCPTDIPGALEQQLFHLLEAQQQLPNVAIRVLPLAAGPHRASVTGEFTILDFPDEGAHPEPTTIYLESHTGALYLDRPREAEAYDRIWSSLATKALSAEESSKLITTIMKELNGVA